jgi:membrane associated rhomboid family serine protease
MYQSTYQPNFRLGVFPPVIKNLLIVNALVFLAQLVPTTNAFLTDWFALWPLDTPDLPGFGSFLPWQLVTYGFLHGDFTHLLFNMFALWMFGIQIENTWGSQPFAIFYFVSVIGAGLVQLAVATMGPGAYATIGASGGVFGILLAFGMMFPDQPIYIYFLLPIKAKWFVIIYGVLELYAGVGSYGSPIGQNAVAHFAHLGGMLFGFLLIQYWRGRLPVKPERRMHW